MSSSEDEMLGQEVEQELEVQTKPTKKTKLTSSQRLQLIDAYRHGKTDKFYNVVPMKNKPGEYRVIKRKKPLDIPITDNDSDEINMNVEPPHSASGRALSGESEKNVKNEPVSEKNVEKKNKIKQEFFTMQNTINNSLSKEIAAVMEKCNKIEAKMKKQKQKMSQRQHQQQYYPEEQYPEEEYPEGEPIEENRPQEEMYYPRRFNARNRIDLRNF